MGFFSRDKQIDGFKKVNQLVEKMYYIKKHLILKCECFNDSDRTKLASQMDDAIDCYNRILDMDYKKSYWGNEVMHSNVIDYDNKSMLIKDFMQKTYNEFQVIKRICKGTTPVMSQINPNGIPKDFYFDEHKLGVNFSVYQNSPDMQIPPMFIV